MAFECTVCHGNGNDSGCLKLNCSHELCLKCYTKVLKGQGYWRFDILVCPVCGKKVPNREKPNKDSLAVIFSFIRDAAKLRAQIVEVEHQIVVKHRAGKQTSEDERKLDEMVAFLKNRLEILKEHSQPWNSWEENEKMTYLTEASVKRIHEQVAVGAPNLDEHP